MRKNFRIAVVRVNQNWFEFDIESSTADADAVVHLLEKVDKSRIKGTANSQLSEMGFVSTLKFKT